MNAEEANEKGREALVCEDYQQAVGYFRRSIADRPSWSIPHYSLGLTYKFMKSWPECREANLKALELNPEDDATVWNLAISSAALADWETAGKAYSAIGLELPDTPPPWDLKLGLIPIRVSPQEQPEVVWCHRLDPVRACIVNVPFPASGRRYGDIVLNDGEPKGYRKLGEAEVPVFDELMLLQKSDYATYMAELEVRDAGSLDGLIGRFEEHTMYAENWSTSVRMLCRACSEGRPHEQHDRELDSPDEGLARLGVAAKSMGELESLLEQWPGGCLWRLERVL